MKMVDLMRQADREVEEFHRRLGVQTVDKVRTISAESVAVMALVAIALVAESKSMIRLESNASMTKFEAAVSMFCVEIGFVDMEGVDTFFDDKPSVQ
jgi:hypothetical protein